MPYTLISSIWVSGSAELEKITPVGVSRHNGGPIKGFHLISWILWCWRGFRGYRVHNTDTRQPVGRLYISDGSRKISAEKLFQKMFQKSFIMEVKLKVPLKPVNAIRLLQATSSGFRGGLHLARPLRQSLGQLWAWSFQKYSRGYTEKNSAT